MQKAHSDALQGVVLAGIAGFILWKVIPEEIQVPGNIAIAALRPDFWPIVLCVLLVVLSLCLAMGALLSRNGAGVEAARVPGGWPGVVHCLRYLRVMVLLIAYYLAMAATGMLLPSILAFFILAQMYGSRRLSRIIPVAVILPIALYFFFTCVADVQIPVCAAVQNLFQ